VTAIAGRTALVTGGVRRVGLAIANSLREAKVNVLTTARSGSDFDADLSTRDGVESLIAALPPIDLLVNSAANFIHGNDWSDFDATFALNLRAPYFLAQTLGARMRERGYGRIVNMADIAAFEPFPGYLPYSMAKAGIVTMTRGLARALAPDVLVNAIAPGPVLLPVDFDEAQRRAAVAPTMLKRAGTPEDVARAAVFLLESDYITGTVLRVDGGS
jgi:NAD(P)-dependent dehydrogenase (short-subunit alcohol dehydrogenase family)